MVRFAAIASVLLVAATAHADPQQDAKAKAAANAGAALYDKNDFTGAAAKFEEAYKINGDPSYLFDIAQVYRHSGDCIRSADYYGRFLAEVPHPPNEDKIRVWYASQMQCAKEKAATQPVEAVKPDQHDQQEPDKQEPTKQEPTKQEPTKQEPSKQEPIQQPIDRPPVTGGGTGHPALVITLAATGAVALGVGGFFAWDSGYLKDQRTSFLANCSAQNRCSSATVDDYDKRGSRANTLAIVGFAAGGLAIAASATIYFVAGRSSSSETAPVAITPVRGGAIVTRGFAW